MSDNGPQNDLDQLGDALLRTAADIDPGFTEPEQGERIVVVEDRGDLPYLAATVGARTYLRDHKRRLWRLDLRAGRTQWRVFTRDGVVRLSDTGPFDPGAN